MWSSQLPSTLRWPPTATAKSGGNGLFEQAAQAECQAIPVFLYLNCGLAVSSCIAEGVSVLGLEAFYVGRDHVGQFPVGDQMEVGEVTAFSPRTATVERISDPKPLRRTGGLVVTVWTRGG